VSCIDPIMTKNYSLEKHYTISNLNETLYLKERQLVSVKAPINIQKALFKIDDRKFSSEIEFIEIFREVYNNLHDEWSYPRNDIFSSFEIKFYSPKQFDLYINRFETQEEFCERLNEEIHQRKRSLSIIETELNKLTSSAENVNLILNVIKNYKP
jgi:hypothetical protein